MEAFKVHSGLVVPLDRANVDTDLIIPKQFLKSIKKSMILTGWAAVAHQGSPRPKTSKKKRLHKEKNTKKQ